MKIGQLTSNPFFNTQLSVDCLLSYLLKMSFMIAFVDRPRIWCYSPLHLPKVDPRGMNLFWWRLLMVKGEYSTPLWGIVILRWVELPFRKPLSVERSGPQPEKLHFLPWLLRYFPSIVPLIVIWRISSRFINQATWYKLKCVSLYWFLLSFTRVKSKNEDTFLNLDFLKVT